MGATAEELDQIEEMARQDGENQAKITLQLAEMGLKMHAMCTRPREWFGDAAWRAEFVEQMREPMAMYARVNHRLLDGCEDAYRGVAEEFCAAEPNFDALVESGAMAPQLAALLQALTRTRTLNPNQLHHALFEGSDGYVLKPKAMRAPAPDWPPISLTLERVTVKVRWLGLGLGLGLTVRLTVRVRLRARARVRVSLPLSRSSRYTACRAQASRGRGWRARTRAVTRTSRS